MESDLSGIFLLKLITKNIALGSLRSHSMHIRVKNISYDINIDYFL